MFDFPGIFLFFSGSMSYLWCAHCSSASILLISEIGNDERKRMEQSSENARERSIVDLYIGLTDHTGLQIALFIATALIVGALTFLYVLLPLLHWFFAETLDAKILTGEMLWTKATQWEVVIEQAEAGETHYYFNPLLSTLPFLLLVGFGFAVFITTLLPPHLGFMRQKIRREIINTLDRLARWMDIQHLQEPYHFLEKQLLSMDIRQLHHLSVQYGISYNDLEAVHRAVLWEHLPFWNKVWRVNDAIRLYMRSYFTVEYGNQMLGFVYIGAALLIVIIGLRGLKFIPPTKPSIIIFALFLEFVVLILYAITVIYTPSEEARGENVVERTTRENTHTAGEKGTVQKDVENLLKAFLKTSIGKKV